MAVIKLLLIRGGITVNRGDRCAAHLAAASERHIDTVASPGLRKARCQRYMWGLLILMEPRQEMR